MGTVVRWTAKLTGAGGSPLYQFSTRPANGAWKKVRDYSPLDSVSWTALEEGAYEFMVRAIDAETAPPISATTAFQFLSRVTSADPVISRTGNPLVALYSAPPCEGKITVYFHAPGISYKTKTPPRDCIPGKSVNIYVAGMYPETTYFMQQAVESKGRSDFGPPLAFRTGKPPFPLPPVVTSPVSNDLSDRVVLFATASIGYPQLPTVATDLRGRLLWYDHTVNPLLPAQVLQRPAPGGNLIYIGSFSPSIGAPALVNPFVREMDLAGNLVRETSIWAINRQLAEMGVNHRVNWLSHETLHRVGDHTLLFASEEQILTDLQGPGPVNVVGDMILDLDSDFTVRWAWSAFDHLDKSRKATMNEVCSSNQSCGPVYLAPQANDWTHSNSITYVPADGSLVISMRNQDWAVKINYQNGTGPGNVIWRLGPGGDFSLDAPSTDVWFSHQHSVEYVDGRYAIFDNGNTRIIPAQGGKSRGQVWNLDELNRVATPALNVDLDRFYAVVGSSQRLSSGNYLFAGSNIFLSGTPKTDVIEFRPDGARVWGAVYFAYSYRVFRMPDLYSYLP